MSRLRSLLMYAGLIGSLMRAHTDGRLEEKLKLLIKPKVLIVDEIGYMPVDRLSANLFFQLVSRRYEKENPVLPISNASTLRLMAICW